MSNHPAELLCRKIPYALALASCLLGAGCGSSADRGQDGVVQGSAEGLTLTGITLQTVVVPRFLGAVNNGGGTVNATAAVAQAWEAFSLVDVNGGTLESGDSVFLQAGNGQYFQALNGGGSSLNAGSSNTQAWETFKVVKQSGTGSVNNGDIVGLQANSGSWVSAASGGGGAVFAYGGALGSWEQFKINGLPTVVAPPPPVTPPPSTNPVTVNNVSFRATLQNTYLGASNGGGSTVVSTASTVQGWETFSLIDVNGGSLVSGDSVYVKASNGQYLQALNGGGSSLNAGSNNTQTWETFKLVKQSGSGTVNTGDIVGLQASTGSWVSAENGGGGNVFAYGGALGSWESFAIGVGTPSIAPNNWRLVWSDEFNGNGIDYSKWGYDVQRPGWVNNELENYTSRPENARVENGHLVIEARSDWYQGYQYSSARLKTQGHASWTYGRMEASIQLPGGFGTWPGFWMMPDDFSRGWPACGEIDVMEEVGFDPNSIHATTHSLDYNWKSPNQRTAWTNVDGATTGFHVYAVEWYPDHIDFFVDGRKYYTSPNDNTGDNAWPFHKNFYIIMNLAVGGTWGGAQGVDPNIWPRQMLIDYVRVYQK